MAEIKEGLALGVLGGVVGDGHGNKWVKLEDLMSGVLEANAGAGEATECNPGYFMCNTRHEAGTVLSIEGNQPGGVDMSGNKWLRLSDSSPLKT